VSILSDYACGDFLRHVQYAAFADCNTKIKGNDGFAEHAKNTMGSRGKINAFRSFEDTVLKRILDSQNHCSENSIGIQGDVASSVMKLNSVEKLLEPQRLDDHDQLKARNKLSKQIHRNGGFLILQLDIDSEEATTIANLWNCTYDLFSHNNISSEYLRHQVLTRDDLTEHERGSNVAPGFETTGYRYLETSIWRKNGNLTVAGFEKSNILQDIMGCEHADAVVRANLLLTKIGKLFVEVNTLGARTDIAAQHTFKQLNVLTDDGTDLGLDNDTPWSCSMHRLCQYSGKTTQENLPIKENLRSHADWTLATLIPVSEVAGLEIWSPVSRSWICPELTARKHWENLRFKNEEYLPWNAHYVVLMAGKWLEIFTNGLVESAVHRVVATQSKSRCSVPFFLRPRNQVALAMQDAFGENSGHVLDDRDTSVGYLYQFLDQFYI